MSTGFLSDSLGGTACLDVQQKFHPTCVQMHLAAGVAAAWTLWLQTACYEVFARSAHVPTVHLTSRSSMPKFLAYGFPNSKNL